ncbi:thiol S-methyltransferase TMT1A [Hydra vulgaris]|uniref:Thiol S-methyltransferase TMT1A n=1 Tax=Hydra vulgaris TaxID=6087 RepID=A0ABM4C244_HYDVU
MSNLIVSGLTTITTFHLFEGVQDLFDDVKKLMCWLHHSLPENKFVRGLIYAASAILLGRCVPFILRRTEFFAYFDREIFYFHRSCNKEEVLKFKKELFRCFRLDKEHGLPLYADKKLVILDINIGGGANLSYYPLSANIIGTDFDESSESKLLNNILINDFESVKFFCTRMEELSCLSDESVSCVVSFHSLCSVRNKSRALAEIKRVLLPGGKLFFIEHTLEKYRFSSQWFWQKNFALSLFFVQCCAIQIENEIPKAGFSNYSYKEYCVDMTKSCGPLKSLSPHVYGYAVK